MDPIFYRTIDENQRIEVNSFRLPSTELSVIRMEFHVENEKINEALEEERLKVLLFENLKLKRESLTPVNG